MNEFIAEEVLKSIQESTEKPSVRLVRFKREGTLALANATGFCGIPGSCDYLSTSSSEFDGLFNDAAIVLRAISLDAWNYHQDRATAIAAIELAIWHAKSPELKQRLAEDQVALKQMRGRSVLPPAVSKRVRDVGFSIMGISMVLGAMYSCRSTNNSPSVTSSSSQPGPTDTNAGTIYVSASVGEMLAGMRHGMDMQRMQLNFLDDKVKQLGQEIAKERLTLDTTSESAVDDFNQKVDRYNALLQEDKDVAAAFDKQADAYNAELRRYRPQ